MLTVNFPENTGSDARTNNGFSGTTVPTSATTIKNGSTIIGVTLSSSSPTKMSGVTGTFTVWMTSAPSHLGVVIYVGSTAVETLTTFTNSGSAVTKNSVTCYPYTASWTASNGVTAGSSVTARWSYSGSGTLVVYNAVISVVATDWGDGTR